VSQEDAAAAWRASRTQKSCLHSEKPDDEGGKPAAAPSTGWSAMETTWRAGTLPLRLAHNSFLLNWRPRTRPTWNKQLDQAVVGLQTCFHNTPLNMTLIRLFTDRASPASMVPDQVTRLSQDLGGDLKVAWTFPDTLKHHADAERFILYVHSPVYTASGSTMRGLVTRLALACHAAVLTVDYAPIPEDERESGVRDLTKAYKWLVTQPGVNPAKLILMADGLGAALSLNLLAEIRAHDAVSKSSSLPAGIALLSPWVDLSDTSSASWTKHAETDYLTPRVCAFLSEGYAGLLPASDPLVSPAHADLAGLPPTFVSVGACEVLMDQAVAFSGRLKSAGVSVELDEGEDMVHAFQIFAGFAPACQAGILRLAAFCRKMSPAHLCVNAQADGLIGGGSDMFGGDSWQ